ncbi:hypothetical protein MWU53_12625 [Aliiroseovarius sp. S1123]|uniref:hypothetical protein n=1 Tax=unclassified Aliiroseovarius TaxID=2623558 RepID=UPI001FF1907C|nr:hypothetical protein [Aliiroseovarius sp. S1123]MCK0171904.1 hypothetical protein [Aliiroseovarius sp. S1123]
MAALALSLLAGCEGSVAANVSHPQRVDVVIDGEKIGVVPNSDHWAAWWISDKAVSIIPALSTLKPLQVRAIEQVSRCRVVEAEYQQSSLQPSYLQAAVEC